MTTHRIRRRAFASALLTTVLVVSGLVLLTPAVAATVTVNCPSDSLQDAINAATSGMTLKIVGWCEGSFVSTIGLNFVGTPGAVLSGDGQGLVLSLSGGGASTIRSLEITDGYAINGAGVYATGGPLTLDRVLVDDNVVYSTGSTATGGGVYYAGSHLTITHSTFRANQVFDLGAAATTADGGGLWANGPTTISHSTFTRNRALVSTAAAIEGFATGAGAHLNAGPITIDHTSFTNNVDRATVVTPDPSTFGGGGAAGLDVSLATPTQVKMTNSTVSGNVITATAPFGGGSAAGADFDTSKVGNLVLSHDRFIGNTLKASSTGNNSPYARGGGLFANVKHAAIDHIIVAGNSITQISAGGSAIKGAGAELNIASGSIRASTFANNSAHGVSKAATGGSAYIAGGGLELSALMKAVSVSATTISGNTARAETKSGAAIVVGGGLATTQNSSVPGPITVVNSTITSNAARTTGGDDTGEVAGGGVDDGVSIDRFRFDTITGNSVRSNVARNAKGGGYTFDEVATREPTLEATVVVGNTGGRGPNCYGTVSSAGYNTVGPTGICDFKKKPTDRVGVAAKKLKLGKLKANGGPTKTIALGTGSVGLDRVPKHTCRAIVKIDQRGVPRPQGKRPAKCDVGAYERKAKH